MDLGLQGKRAIVCAASKGLGKACAMALGQAGVSVVITGRDAAALAAAANEIHAATGVEIIAAAGDITTPAGREAALAACPDPDILVNNAGGPPPGDFRDFERGNVARRPERQHAEPDRDDQGGAGPMIARRFGRIVNITSAAVKSPIPVLGLSNGARAGLTGFVAGLARDVARHNVTINNLLPGPFDTDRLRATAARSAASSGRSVDEEVLDRGRQNPAGRVGQPEEFGAACAFLCSAHSGFIVGQNLLLDGGAFNSTM